ncbi:VOC family protein [Cumulibacter soli]|uniref:VOC family protein n=1 Tax=Cumulibacter soli TaxID=2546344 RepID=UPI001067A8BB|nr:VOC family protein [Cumulibacter soli]
MDVLSSRVLLRPTDLERSQRFYRDTLGLAVMREFGPPDRPGMVFYLGNGQLEVAGRGTDPAHTTSLWIQVRDVAAEIDRIQGLGWPIVREPKREFWGLIEAWIADPDGVPIVLVQIPEDHPLRRDQRDL